MLYERYIYFVTDFEFEICFSDIFRSHCIKTYLLRFFAISAKGPSVFKQDVQDEEEEVDKQILNNKLSRNYD